MEATQGVSLYSCLYLKLSKTLCLSYYLLCFFFNKIREEEEGMEGGDQAMYTHLGECKNDKIKNISHLLRIILISYFHKCIKVKWVFRKYIWISVKIKCSKVLMLKYIEKY
jgi:hypothetical protein